MSVDMRRQYPRPLAAMEVADARSIPRPDQSAGAVLLMGPLYHITERGERLSALREAKRLLRPGGTLSTGRRSWPGSSPRRALRRRTCAA